MKRKTLISVALMVVSAILAVVGIIMLPEVVTTQLTIGGDGVSTMPKAFAIAIPTILGLGGGFGFIMSKGTEQDKNKWLAVSAIGILAFGLTLILNL